MSEKPETNQPTDPEADQRYSSTGRLIKDASGEQPIQPKTVKKMLTRFVICALLIAGLLVIYQMIGKKIGDPGDVGSAETVGQIAAIQYLEKGSQVVIINPDGTIKKSPDFVEGKSDFDPVWRPDGNRLFFVSNRSIRDNTSANNIFRWNLSTGQVEPRTYGTRSKSAPLYDGGVESSINSALMISGGLVLDFDQSKAEMRQILPPVTKETKVDGSDGQGASGQLDTVYEKFGTSFKKAMYSKDRNYVIAVMRREDAEVFIIQNIADPSKPPLPIAAGSHIEFDVNPVNGDIFFSVLEFKLPLPEMIPPEMIKNGKVTYPYRHVFGFLPPPSDTMEPFTIIIPFMDDKQVFKNIDVSPDGTSLTVLVGEYIGNGMVDLQLLGKMPATPNGPENAVEITKGKVFDVSWSPDSLSLLYSQYVGSNRDIFMYDTVKRTPKNLTNGKGNFGQPRMSPQVRK